MASSSLKRGGAVTFGALAVLPLAASQADARAVDQNGDPVPASKPEAPKPVAKPKAATPPARAPHPANPTIAVKPAPKPKKVSEPKTTPPSATHQRKVEHQLGNTPANPTIDARPAPSAVRPPETPGIGMQPRPAEPANPTAVAPVPPKKHAPQASEPNRRAVPPGHDLGPGDPVPERYRPDPKPEPVPDHMIPRPSDSPGERGGELPSSAPQTPDKEPAKSSDDKDHSGSGAPWFTSKQGITDKFAHKTADGTKKVAKATKKWVDEKPVCAGGSFYRYGGGGATVCVDLKTGKTFVSGELGVGQGAFVDLHRVDALPKRGYCGVGVSVSYPVVSGTFEYRYDGKHWYPSSQVDPGVPYRRTGLTPTTDGISRSPSEGKHTGKGSKKVLVRTPPAPTHRGAPSTGKNLSKFTSAGGAKAYGTCGTRGPTLP